MAGPSPLRYTLFDDLLRLIPENPGDSIISRTIYCDAYMKVVLFGFSAEQFLSEQTESQTAIIHVLSGQGVIALGNDVYEVESGAWVRMPPHLAHSVEATTPLIMLLLLISEA